MKNLAIAISLIACLCAAACHKTDEPDLSVYTSKLAGNKVWKRMYSYTATGANPDTVYLSDSTMEIIVKDNEHILFNDVNLSYKSFSESELTYSWAPQGSDYSARLSYYHKLDSAVFYYSFNHHGGYNRSIFTRIN